jgi:hypothetical protein
MTSSNSVYPQAARVRRAKPPSRGRCREHGKASPTWSQRLIESTRRRATERHTAAFHVATHCVRRCPATYACQAAWEPLQSAAPPSRRVARRTRKGRSQRLRHARVASLRRVRTGGDTRAITWTRNSSTATAPRRPSRWAASSRRAALRPRPAVSSSRAASPRPRIGASARRAPHPDFRSESR